MAGLHCHSSVRAWNLCWYMYASTSYTLLLLMYCEKASKLCICTILFVHGFEHSKVSGAEKIKGCIYNIYKYKHTQMCVRELCH